MKQHLKKIKGLGLKSIKEIRPLLKFMNKKQQREVIYSKVLSTVNYGLALYHNQPESLEDNLITLYMRCDRAILGYPVPLKTKMNRYANR